MTWKASLGSPRGTHFPPFGSQHLNTHAARPQHEEPDALIAHVRICGGRGKVTSLVYPTATGFHPSLTNTYNRESKPLQTTALLRCYYPARKG